MAQSQLLKISVLGKEILRYWREHPSASDTADGIAVWWVQYKQFEHTRSRVKQALLELVKKQLVVKKHHGTAEDTYELNPVVKSQLPRILGSERGGRRRDLR